MTSEAAEVAEPPASSEESARQLYDLPPLEGKAAYLTVAAVSGSRLTPRQIIAFYPPDEWERFIREWVEALEPRYHRVRQFGGTSDRGIDVAGLLTASGLDGEWDCFQCKHYADALTPSDLWPELLKIFRAVVEGHYTRPRRYEILAPWGCGQTLERLVSSPSKLKRVFLSSIEPGKPNVRGIDLGLLAQIRDYCDQQDFSFVGSVTLAEVLDLHRTTPHFAARFGGPLPERPAAQPPPDEFSPEETRYIEQLVEVYREKYPGIIESFGDVQAHARVLQHFRRQRESFYSAESLRMFAREQVPPGTFEALQDDLHNGVAETEDRDFDTGMERLTSVLEIANQLNLTSNALLTVSRPKDRSGICHQLANQDRLKWCRGEES